MLAFCACLHVEDSENLFQVPLFRYWNYYSGILHKFSEENMKKECCVWYSFDAGSSIFIIGITGVGS